MQVLVYFNKRLSHIYVRSFVFVFDSFLDSLGGVRCGVKVIVWHLIQKIQLYRRDDHCRLPDFAGVVIWRYLEYSEGEEASFTSTYTMRSLEESYVITRAIHRQGLSLWHERARQ